MIIGIVGKPSTGKSTFFKALTMSDVDIANYPFTTIEANEGIAHVRIPCADKEFDTQCNPREGFCIEHQRFVPVKVLDVAGLVPGAHEGKGRGNQFLDDLRQADALIHIVDAAGNTNELGEPITPGTYDPANDVRFLEEELDYWYLGILKKGWEKFARTVQQEKSEVHKALAKQLSGLGITEDMIKDAIKKLGLNPQVPASWTDEHLFALANDLRKQTKPMIVAANKVDTQSGRENVKKLQEEFPDHLIIPCSADSELALKGAEKHKLIKYIPGDAEFSYCDESSLNEQQKAALELIKNKVLLEFGSTGVQKVINTAVFDLLKYIAIFPGGMKKLEDSEGRTLPDCFLMPPRTTALAFAYKLHSDFGKNFIRANDVKKKVAVGKDHVLNNGDVIEIISGK